MSFTDQGVSQGRIWAIIGVAILHALLAYAFVTGLAYKFVKSVQEDLKTFEVVEEPPPPEEVPPPPETPKEVAPPPVVAPPPLVRTNVPPPPIFSVPAAPPPPVTYTAPPAPPAPPPPPPPPPPRVQEPARARANLAGLISSDDYPPSALRNEEQGTVRVRLNVDTSGRVTGCSVSQSSGSSQLDQTTCRLLQRRARFTPARDNQGQPIADTVTSPPIRWQIQQ